MELAAARTIGERVLQVMGSSCVRAEIAGSVRRKKSDVKDIEIVAIISDYELLFASLRDVGVFIKPGVPDVIPWEPKVGAKYLRLMLNEQIKLDLFVASEDNWGTLYMMRTGSATGKNGDAWNGFIPKMFHRWKVLSGGGKMTGCLPTSVDGTQLPCPEEIDFFELLDMNFVPPEERIDGSVIKKYIKEK